MEKDTRLINIYLKIHHKRTLTIDDLNYLAKYDPECFKKTCKNVVYNIPETKPIMIPDALKPVRRKGQDPGQGLSQRGGRSPKRGSLKMDEPDQGTGALRKDETESGGMGVPESSDWQDIEKVLENLRHLEMHDFPVVDIDADRVKDLLGNLYMELLFPHNDNYPFMNMMDQINDPIFDKKA
jgi:hypothetical protein